ncbi:hypothetical protein C7B77_10785 [Chamaesiphon polymorphus CCALA 037]|uniref:Uncharacterized protein n=1 Tax=Chamaesiphon polymorphus CCALA 037 TaxID=2107692 RepID=A0A2T1GGK1_9CYAN|nr:hypothetical protein C7B77_10785 [Chamaesiphon polymorphus CCALA 037]
MNIPSAVTVAREEGLVKLPKKTNASCEASINSVKNQLIKNGYFSLKPTAGLSGEVFKSNIQIDKNRIRNSYYEYPTARPELVSIHLTSDSKKVLGTFSRSPQLMVNLGAQIIAGCDRVGMVEFSAPWEEFVRPVGYFNDNTVRTFSWIENRDEAEIRSGKYPNQRVVVTPTGSMSMYKWGYYYSP